MCQRVLAHIAATMLTACTYSAPPAHGDVAFSPEERAAIERGNEWLADHMGHGPVDIAWDLPHDDVSQPPPRSIVRVQTMANQGAFFAGSVYLPGRYRDAETLAALAAHEFGHYRRLEHHDGPGLMNPTVLGLVWTEEDQVACAELCR